MQIPTVPATFVAGDSSLVKMQQLAQCVAFVSNAQRSPMWHVYSYIASNVIGVGASSWTSIPWYFCALDTDQVYTSPNATAVFIRTQGYYAVEACVPFSVQSGTYNANAAFLWTAGQYNPHFASGTTLQFGLRAGFVATGTSADEVICIDDICPNVCYPGDQIAVQAWGSIATSINIGGPTSSIAGRCTCNFTGRWIRTGS